MPYVVFVSHSCRDDDLLNVLRAMLGSGGLVVYVAEDDRMFGDDVSGKVKDAISQSDLVLGLWTKDGSMSAYLNQELGYAEALGKPIVLLVEKGHQPKGFFVGREYASFSRGDPLAVIQEVVDYLEKKMEDKGFGEAASAAVVAMLAVLVVIIIVWAISRR